MKRLPGTLPLQSRRRDTLDEVLLRKEEDEHDREGHHHGRRHEKVIAGFGCEADPSGIEGGDAERKRELARTAEKDQRIEEVVPMGQKRDDRGRGKGRFGQGDDDLPVDPKVPGAIEPRRFKQFLGNRAKELSKQKDEERTSTKPVGNDQRPECVDPADMPKDDERWNNGQFRGKHDRPENAQEQKLAASKPKACEAITDDRGRYDLAGSRRQRHVEGVQEESTKRDQLPDPKVVSPMPRLGDPDGGNLLNFGNGLERTGECPVRRDREHHRQENAREVHRQPAWRQCLPRSTWVLLECSHRHHLGLPVFVMDPS